MPRFDHSRTAWAQLLSGGDVGLGILTASQLKS
jgi:hypothetical protein